MNDKKYDVIIYFSDSQSGVGDYVITKDVNGRIGRVFFWQKAIFQLAGEVVRKFWNLRFNLVIKKLGEFYLLPVRFFKKRYAASFEFRVKPASFCSDKETFFPDTNHIPPNIFLTLKPPVN